MISAFGRLGSLVAGLGVAAAVAATTSAAGRRHPLHVARSIRAKLGRRGAQ